jgi:hypothetical protein
MAAIIILIGILVYIFYVVYKTLYSPKPATEVRDSGSSKDDKKRELKYQSAEELLGTVTIRVTTSVSNNIDNDDSVIDITGNHEKIIAQRDFPTPENLQLGDKYKDELKLNKKQVEILNKLIDTDNKFNSIRFCAINLIELLFDCLNHLEECLGSDEYNKVKTEVLDAEARKYYRYKQGSNNYKRILLELIDNYNQCVYKTCENELRDFLNVGRKTELTYYLRSKESLDTFNTKIAIILIPFIKEKLAAINDIDIESEIKINNYNRGRYKSILEKLKSEFYENDIDSFKQKIIDLETRNVGNPYLENIYYEASKFIAKYNKQVALEFYIKYIYHDLKSPNFDNKQLTKTIQRSLFKTTEQLQNFEAIINDLIKDQNLDKALLTVSTIYEPKRKKIELDRNTIHEVQQQHSGTVELLNEYLRDEFDENNSITEIDLNIDAVQIEIVPTKGNAPASAFLSELNLNEIQISALELFVKNNFSIPQIEIADFAKSKGVFKNQLIESINETCFEILDDILIEEEDDYYTINQEYFTKISS